MQERTILCLILLVILIIILYRNPDSTIGQFIHGIFASTNNEEFMKGGRDKTILYYVYPSEHDSNFQTSVKAILDTSHWNNTYDIAYTDDKKKAKITIKLMTHDELKQYHNKPRYYPDGRRIRFSITTQSPSSKPEIFIDLDNWTKGIPESNHTLEDYRTYVINHEFGHGLGYDHQECDDNTKQCPLMFQQTVGVPNGYTGITQPTDIDYTNPISGRYKKLLS